MSTNDGTRDAERVYLAGEVTGEVSVYEPMSILDLSERGALVETRFPLHLDSLHDFRLVASGRSGHHQGAHRAQPGRAGSSREPSSTAPAWNSPSLRNTHCAAIRSFVERQKLAALGAPPIVDAELAE